MKTLASLVILLLNVNCALASMTAVWNGNGHTYELVEENLTWLDAYASSSARTLGGQAGYLATITSQEEQDFIYSTFDRPGLHAAWIGLTSHPDFGGAGNPGIGGSAAPYWVWISGEPTDYVNWVRAENGFPYYEPNNLSGDEYFVELVFTNTDGTPGRWNDLASEYFDGNTRYPYVESRYLAAPQQRGGPLNFFAPAAQRSFTNPYLHTG
jgi:hypothetical protein